MSAPGACVSPAGWRSRRPAPSLPDPRSGREPGIALDAACGTGRFAEFLAGRGHQVIEPLPVPVTEVGDWQYWPWPLMSDLTSAAQAAASGPALVVWHFALPTASAGRWHTRRS